MTLQEKVFMCDLIKKNYRRRMFIFTFFVVAICAPIIVIIFLKLGIAADLLLGSLSFLIFLVALFHYQKKIIQLIYHGVLKDYKTRLYRLTQKVTLTS